MMLFLLLLLCVLAVLLGVVVVVVLVAVVVVMVLVVMMPSINNDPDPDSLAPLAPPSAAAAVGVLLLPTSLASLALLCDRHQWRRPSIATLLAHRVRGHRRFHIYRLHIRGPDHFAFRRIPDLFLRHNSIDF